jgi:hypothetical protein
MVLQFNDYCYAKQLLHEQGLHVQIRDKRILVPTRNTYQTKQVITELIKGDELLEKEKVKTITDYTDLIKMGYIIISQHVRKRWFRGQRVIYSIVRKSMPGNIGNIPSGHRIIMSTLHKKIRLVGPNASPSGYGPWVNLGPIRKTDTIVERRFDFKYVKNNRSKVLKKILGQEDLTDVEYFAIPELPVMFSNGGELVCIPQIEDEYVIIVVGRRGSGKTYTTASISSRLYWCWNKRMIMLNDHHDQCQTWALPNMQGGAIQQLKRIGNDPMPLPLCFLYPKTNTFTVDKVFGGVEGDLSFLISLPLYEIIQDYKNYLKGNKDWELKGGTAVLFRNMQDALLKCSTFNEVKRAIGNYKISDEDKRFSISPQSQAKIISTMDDLFSQQILDSGTGIPSKWGLINTRTNSGEELYPVIALLKSRIIPVIKTKDVITKFYYSQYMKFIIDSIFNNQTLNPWFSNNQIAIYMIIDEITDIANKQNLFGAGCQSLISCATQGRPNRIGIVANTQDYTRIPDTIINQTEYCFTLQLKDKEAQKVGKDFELAKHQIEDIKNLEKFEMMALTKRKFIIYDKNGRRRESGPEEAIRGYSLPPLCQHTPPKR